MTPEELAREKIDAMLTASGWAVQNRDKINLCASRGVAVSELCSAMNTVLAARDIINIKFDVAFSWTSR